MSGGEPPRRRSLRLRRFDYSSAGAYFVAICTQERACEDQVILGALGLIVQEEWPRSPLVRCGVSLDEYMIMPNHIHGIVVLEEPVGATRRVAPTPRPRSGPIPGSLPAIIAQFKGQSGKRINILRATPGFRVWQRGYDDHIIRDEQDLHRFREYILYNPLCWALDEENPGRGRP